MQAPIPFQRRLTLRLLEAAGQWIDLKICNVMGQVLVGKPSMLTMKARWS
ncbi:MAG: hypothetical protein U0176_14855 [Bacteroidia bacterium]